MSIAALLGEKGKQKPFKKCNKFNCKSLKATHQKGTKKKGLKNKKKQDRNASKTEANTVCIDA